MSSNFSVTPTLPVENLARARQFYEDKLDLKPLATSSSGVLYECSTDTKLLIYESKAIKCGCIAAIFEVENLQGEVRAREKKGVVFEKYEMTDISIVDELTSLSTGNVASFRDSEGNILALVQMGMLLEANGVLSPFRK
jgi:predicted enzyme related to lactoylglutathione lyase